MFTFLHIFFDKEKWQKLLVYSKNSIFLQKINADIRLNYEKYFYDDIMFAKPSERDKAVVELMVHF